MRIRVAPRGDVGRSDRDAMGETGQLKLTSLVPFQNGLSVWKSSSDGKSHTTAINMMTVTMVTVSMYLRSFTVQLLSGGGSQFFGSAGHIFLQLVSGIESDLGY